MVTFLPLVNASGVSSVSLEVYPAQGDITTEIFLHVRGYPHLINREGFLYLYLDDKCVIQRMPCISHNHAWNVWELSWDVIFKVPNEYPYSELGLHNLTAVIEVSDGTSANVTTTFEIINYIPSPYWWEDLPEDFIDVITGPQGMKGDKGDTGSQGIQGKQGEVGPQGEIGKQGFKGDTGLIGPTGIQGLKGEKGEQGDKGIQGEQGEVSFIALLISMGITWIVFIVLIIILSGSEPSILEEKIKVLEEKLKEKHKE